MADANTYLISYPHDAAGRAYYHESTRNEAFNACFLCRIGERDLIKLRLGSNGTDDGVYAGQDASELSIILDLGDMELDSTFFEL